jgi:hypothetical protein
MRLSAKVDADQQINSLSITSEHEKLIGRLIRPKLKLCLQQRINVCCDRSLG